MTPEFRQQLTDATAGLLYPSETDAPFDVIELAPPFPWETTAAPVIRVPVRQFFAELRDGPDAAGYHALDGLLTAALADLQVVRVGDTSISIYLTGIAREDAHGAAPTKNRVGLLTHAVET